ncbi:MAG: S8 family serine peptidase [Oligoflexia bacterium]|nr:S8 family serine peptidase [Oligoflexia bacterium]
MSKLKLHFLMLLFSSSLLLIFVSIVPVWATTGVVDPERLLIQFGINPYHVSDQQLQNVKIAILDNGFGGYAPEKELLPTSTQLVQLTQIPQGSTNHGLGMAQIVWALTGQLPNGPSFYLVNTNGFSNFKAAVQYVIDQKMDIVLYSQVWPFGGNYDGNGFINALVTKAVQAGVIWINAAGNYGYKVYNGYVIDTCDKSLRFENKFDEGSATITLSWNDFTDDDSYNSSKDLDLFVYDENEKLVASSTYIQRNEAPAPGKDPLLSSHAREVITLQDLDKGIYKIKIKMKSNNFIPSDRLRIIIKDDREEAISFVDHTNDGEIMPPADNPLAITVGEGVKFSSIGPTADGRVKPDTIIQDATVAFSNGMGTRGSSNAAAIFTGIVSVMKAYAPQLKIEHLRELIRLNQQTRISGVSVGVGVGAGYADLMECPSNEPIEPRLQQLIPARGQLMMNRYDRHYVVITREDPFFLPGPMSARISRAAQNDVIAYDLRTQRWSMISGSMVARVLRPPLVEFRKANNVVERPPRKNYLWKTPTPVELEKIFSQ